MHIIILFPSTDDPLPSTKDDYKEEMKDIE